MHKIEIGLAGTIYWRVPLSLTHSPPLSELGGWSIAAPFLWSDNDDPTGPFLMKNDDVLINSRRIVLVTDDSSKIPNRIASFANIVKPFLGSLRIAARQATVPRSIVVLQSPTEFDDFPNFEPPSPVNVSFRKHLVDWAANFQHALAANEMLLDQNVAVHSDLANDACEHLCNDNFRSAIIFAATAIEACAGTCLDKEYETLVNSSAVSGIHRLTSIQVNRSTRTTKDPVFLALRNGAGDGGSRFLSLLHETPLYLLNKSLNLENSGVYQRAHSLYRTRNRLAHTGQLGDNTDGLLEVTHGGAIAALRTMNDVIEWFGETGTILPDFEFFDLHPGDK